MSIAIEDLTPLDTHVIVELDPFQEQYRNGLVLKPYQEKDKAFYTATVLTTGPKAPVKPGDRVVIDRYVRDTLDGLFGRNIILIDGAAGERCDIFGVIDELPEDGVGKPNQLS